MIDGYMTPEELEDYKKMLERIPKVTYTPNYTPSPCTHCSNHPSNGGSGVCMCILGSPKVTC